MWRISDMVVTNPRLDDKGRTVLHVDYSQSFTTISWTLVGLIDRKTVTMYTPLVLALVTLAAAHPGYRDSIPNGYTVPNPCGSDSWQAVGHYDPFHHTIAKNQFGKVRLAIIYTVMSVYMWIDWVPGNHFGSRVQKGYNPILIALA